MNGRHRQSEIETLGNLSHVKKITIVGFTISLPTKKTAKKPLIGTRIDRNFIQETLLIGDLGSTNQELIASAGDLYKIN